LQPFEQNNHHRRSLRTETRGADGDDGLDFSFFCTTSLVFSVATFADEERRLLRDYFDIFSSSFAFSPCIVSTAKVSGCPHT
jgi:hypothetical protein